MSSIFECAVEGHYSPTMHSTKEMEALLTAAQKFILIVDGGETAPERS